MADVTRLCVSSCSSERIVPICFWKMAIWSLCIMMFPCSWAELWYMLLQGSCLQLRSLSMWWRALGTQAPLLLQPSKPHLPSTLSEQGSAFPQDLLFGLIIMDFLMKKKKKRCFESKGNGRGKGYTKHLTLIWFDFQRSGWNFCYWLKWEKT